MPTIEQSSIELPYTYIEHDPFLIHKVEKLDSIRTNDGFYFDLYLQPKMKNTLRRTVVGGEHVPNPWLRALRLGQNPSNDYLAERVRYLSEVAQIDEVVHLATREHPMRWAGAGGLLIMKDTQAGRSYIPLTIRPENAIRGNSLDSFGGLSSNMHDWMRPFALAQREVAEECLLVKGYTLLNIGLGEEKTIQRNRKIAAQVLGRDVAQLEFVQAENLTDKSKADTVNIHLGQNVFPTFGLVIIDPTTAAFDLRYIFEVKIAGISDLVLVDGETQTGNPDKSQDRKIYLFEKSDLLKYIRGEIETLVPVKTFQSGILLETKGLVVTGDKINLTPVLEKMIAALG